MTVDADILVIGAGMAGASIAAQLAAAHRVIIVEREPHAGYHSTGRSAAVFTETYGGNTVRALAAASRGFFENPPAGFAQTPLLNPRGVLYIATPDDRESVEALLCRPGVAQRTQRISAAEARKLVPILRESHVAQAIHEPNASDIDVHQVLEGFLRQARRGGAQVRFNCELLGLSRTPGGWLADTTIGPISAACIVNAAGAWADQVGQLAQAQPIGLQPGRRTALLVEAPEGLDITRWPLTVDVNELFYLKPDAGRLLLSPVDDTPSAPCDAQPDEYDIATAVDRVEKATVLDVRRVLRKWAGLRSSVRDGIPVIGHDTRARGFFWLAGQGGYGIQAAPAMARIAASLLTGRPIPAEIADLGIVAQELSPSRLLRTA